MTWDETKQTLNDRPDIDSAEKLTSADWNDMVADQKDHADRHGYDGTDELATALRYDPQSEPATPTSGCVRWYDDTDDAYKVKFDDGGVITVGER